jgi:hypothetical protein
VRFQKLSGPDNDNDNDNERPTGWLYSRKLRDGHSDMVILRLDCQIRMVTKGYRKGVYKWVEGKLSNLVIE